MGLAIGAIILVYLIIKAASAVEQDKRHKEFIKNLEKYDKKEETKQ
tara:strand:- start:177 stop:314 length:138 start_codon:yes stop_codon:yes gene_type:complete